MCCPLLGPIRLGRMMPSWHCSSSFPFFSRLLRFCWFPSFPVPYSFSCLLCRVITSHLQGREEDEEEGKIKKMERDSFRLRAGSIRRQQKQLGCGHCAEGEGEEGGKLNAADAEKANGRIFAIIFFFLTQRTAHTLEWWFCCRSGKGDSICGACLCAIDSFVFEAILIGKKGEERGKKTYCYSFFSVAFDCHRESIEKYSFFLMLLLMWGGLYGSSAVPAFSSCCEKVFYLHFCFISL